MVGRFLNFLLVPLYTSKLPNVQAYGVVNVMFSYAAFFSVIFTFGMETAFFNFARKEHDLKGVFATAARWLLGLGLGLVLFAVLFSHQIMDWAGYPAHPEYAVWFALIIAADSLAAIGFARLRYLDKAVKFSVLKMLNIGLAIGLNLFFLLLCPMLAPHSEWIRGIYDPSQLVNYIFISNLVASGFTLICFLPVLGSIFSVEGKGLLKPMLRYAWPMVIVGFAGMINETLDRILLKQLLPGVEGDYQAGIYGAFYKLSLVMTLFIQAFRFAAEPFFFKTGGDKNSAANIASVTKWFAYACALIYVFTMALLPWIAPLLIRNPAYFADARGMAVVPVLLVANIALGLYYNLSVWYKLSEKTLYGAYISMAGAAITLVGNFIFIPKIGFVASAWVTLIAYTAMLVLSYFWGSRHYPVKYDLLRILGPIAFGILLCCLVQEFFPGNIGAGVGALVLSLGAILFIERKSLWTASK